MNIFKHMEIDVLQMSKLIWVPPQPHPSLILLSVHKKYWYFSIHIVLEII